MEEWIARTELAKTILSQIKACDLYFRCYRHPGYFCAVVFGSESVSSSYQNHRSQWLLIYRSG